ncbi:MAG: hypothetical protein WBX15_09310 [Thermoanaerobaculia bacterium]
MPLTFEHLDEHTRQLMLLEFTADASVRALYFSPRLSVRGRIRYAVQMGTAIRNGTPDQLMVELNAPGILEESATSRRSRRSSAAARIAEEEFNRYYMRAVCRRALEEGIEAVEVSRSIHARIGRRRIEPVIGKLLPARSLLAELRSHLELGTILGIEEELARFLTVRLPRARRRRHETSEMHSREEIETMEAGSSGLGRRT